MSECFTLTEEEFTEVGRVASVFVLQMTLKCHSAQVTLPQMSCRVAGVIICR